MQADEWSTRTSKQWPCSSSCISSESQALVATLLDSSCPGHISMGRGKRLSNAPEHGAHANTRLAFMAPALLVPCGVDLEQSTRVRCLKGNFSRKVQTPLPSYLATRAFSLAFLSSTTIVALKQCPNRLVCWLPPNIIDHDSLQFTTKTLSSRLIWQRELPPEKKLKRLSLDSCLSACPCIFSVMNPF